LVQNWDNMSSKKNKTIIVKTTLPANQAKIIRRMIGTIGTNQSDVVGKIILMWLTEHGYIGKKEDEK